MPKFCFNLRKVLAILKSNPNTKIDTTHISICNGKEVTGYSINLNNCASLRKSMKHYYGCDFDGIYDDDVISLILDIAHKEDCRCYNSFIHIDITHMDNDDLETYAYFICGSNSGDIKSKTDRVFLKRLIKYIPYEGDHNAYA